MREIVAIHGTREARLAAWSRTMGGGAADRRFDRRLAEVKAGEKGAA